MSELIKKDFFSKIQKGWVEQSGMNDSVFQKEVSFAMQQIQRNPYLLECDHDSILKAVMNIAQVGLTLNPVQKLAYLVPRRFKGKLECCLDPSYMGLVKLLTDTGSVTSIQCQLIHEGDEVEVDLGHPEKVLKHVPYFLAGNEKGSIRGAYSRATLHDSSIHAEVMSYRDLMEIRDRSEGYKSYKEGKVKTCIWVSDEGEMCRKTIIKRHWKYLPKTDQSEKFDRAVELDNEANGYDSLVDWSTISILEDKIKRSNLTEEKKSELMRQLPNLEKQTHAMQMMDYLNRNQPVIGVERAPHSAKEVEEAMSYQDAKESLYERKKP